MPQQLSLDTLVKKRKNQPDCWTGFVFRHYGELYGLRIMGFDKNVHIAGKDYAVVHGRMNVDETEETTIENQKANH